MVKHEARVGAMVTAVNTLLYHSGIRVTVSASTFIVLLFGPCLCLWLDRLDRHLLLSKPDLLTNKP